jgi:hypothetical protein
MAGMSSSVLSNMSAYTFFEDLIQNKQINNPYFSVFLVRGRQYSSGATDALIGGSTICLGCMAQTTNVQTYGSMWVFKCPTSRRIQLTLTGSTCPLPYLRSMRSRCRVLV